MLKLSLFERSTSTTSRTTIFTLPILESVGKIVEIKLALIRKNFGGLFLQEDDLVHKNGV